MSTLCILCSEQLDRHYIGHTTEPIGERLRKHLADHSGWTSRAMDWRVVHSEVHADKAAAYRYEREITVWKSCCRIEELIREAR